MGVCRYQLAAGDGDPLIGWSAAVVAGQAGSVRLDARYATSRGGWLRVSVGGLQVVPPREAASAGANGRVAFQAGDQGISLELEAARVSSVDEAVAAGRRLCRCLESGRLELVEPCGGRART